MKYSLAIQFWYLEETIFKSVHVESTTPDVMQLVISLDSLPVGTQLTFEDIKKLVKLALQACFTARLASFIASFLTRVQKMQQQTYIEIKQPIFYNNDIATAVICLPSLEDILQLRNEISINNNSFISFKNNKLLLRSNFNRDTKLLIIPSITETSSTSSDKNTIGKSLVKSAASLAQTLISSLKST